MTTTTLYSLRSPVLFVLACCLALAAAAAEQPASAATVIADPAPPTQDEGVSESVAAAADAATQPADTPVVEPVDVPDTAEETIALAREFLGGDELLDSITSIHFRGSILMENGNSGDVDIIVKKPMRQYVTITLGTTKEITALDDYEAWRRVERTAQNGEWELTLLDADQVRRLRANAFENIAFFKGVESVRGSFEFLGEAEKDGIPCLKVAFVHPGDVRFVRYFNRDTGRLVVTETDTGGTIREKGEIRVRGVRFPKELVNSAANGSSTVIFSSITLNEEFPDSLFEVPIAVPGP